jgi:chemotaxis protein MotB
MGTFADLMSLLMCFFVLLLSFSEMDVQKFKQIAGSMAFAFGVQNKIEVKDIPKGTSVIAMEFRPGRPDPTPIDTIQQQTMDMTQQIIIRIRENGSFPSGSTFLQPRFKPIIQQIGAILKDIPGEITVTGHTDNDQVSDELNSNNWELSAKRAVSVAVELMSGTGLDKNRLVVVGHADTRPIVPNNTEQNRRRNRRVEISIMQGKAKESDPIELRQPGGN